MAALENTGEAGAEAVEIIEYLTGLTYSQQILNPGAHLEDEGTFSRIIKGRASGIPLAYLLNRKYFYALPFYVDENVLIPRADSECVAEEAIRLMRSRGYRTLLDLCCGSGCLGIAAANEGGAELAAFSDISAGAVNVAQKNAAALLKCARSVFFISDLFKSIDGRYDIIICNPPYISAEEFAALEPQVRDYEPKAALLGGDTGMEFYRKICGAARDFLNPGGAVVFETGYSQRRSVEGVMSSFGIEIINAGRDVAGRPRFISGAFI